MLRQPTNLERTAQWRIHFLLCVRCTCYIIAFKPTVMRNMGDQQSSPLNITFLSNLSWTKSWLVCFKLTLCGLSFCRTLDKFNVIEADWEAGETFFEGDCFTVTLAWLWNKDLILIWHWVYASALPLWCPNRMLSPNYLDNWSGSWTLQIPLLDFKGESVIQR